jgi:anhydro-N-acetylmuramic acid kinase
MDHKKNLYLGVMSGTSLDGIDIVLIKKTSKIIKVVGSIYASYNKSFKEKILKLSFSSQNELEDSQILAIEHAKLTAKYINQLLDKLEIPSNNIAAIGYHGQTIRHRPEKGFSIQIGNAHFLVEKTNINVVSDFRNRDIAAGGEGAPLVPAFHDFYFASKNKKRVVLNIGGISNITFLNNNKKTIGFDCGPGNILLDHWIFKNKKLNYDSDGSWARSGNLIPILLKRFLRENYFKKPLPKSCGRELFNLDWIYKHRVDSFKAEDIQRTLLELTALTISSAITKFCINVDEIFICGGGSENNFLIERLSQIIEIPIQKTDALGLPSQLVESAAFAWLASKALANEKNNSPGITGSKGNRILGVTYYA